jgi:hypothetical protein
MLGMGRMDADLKNQGEKRTMKGAIAFVFSVAVMMIAAAKVGWLFATGAVAEVSGIMLAQAGLLAVLFFAFKAADAVRPSPLSLVAPPNRASSP